MIEDGAPVVVTSATQGTGIEDLRAAIADVLCDRERLRDAPSLSNVRHIRLLEMARDALARARAAAASAAPEEFVLTDLHEARGALESVTGARTTEDMLAHIFERFCIGK
jgi:tRNA modification GTPase